MYEKIQTDMKLWFKDYNNLFQLQEQFLLSLLDYFKETAIGKERGYQSIKTLEQFQERTPIQDYSDIKPYIDRIIAGETNVMSPSPISCWIQTSGSTGKPKFFPYNEDYIQNYLKSSSFVTKNFIYRVGFQALNILKGKTLLIHARINSGVLGSGKNRKKLALISGWAATQSSPQNSFAPPSYIQEIENWEERILKTAVYYVQKDLTRLMGVTTYLLMFLREIENGFDGKLLAELEKENSKKNVLIKQILQEDGKLTISKLWENLLFLNCTGINPYQYQKVFQQIVPKGIVFQSYIGSEGLYGFQYDIDHPAMVLMPKNAFYEFLDIDEYDSWKFNNGKCPTRYTVTDVKTGKEYIFCISNYLGLTTYIPGDIIKVVSTKPFLFVYSRRLLKEINLASEKMSESQITKAVNLGLSQHSAIYREYMCIAITEPYPHYVIAIDFVIPPQNLNQFATDIEQSILNANISYEEVRNMKILKPLRILYLQPGEFDRYILEKTKLSQWNPGQKKLPKITDSQDFLPFFRVKAEGVSNLI
ncbi:MAG: GH3 auxin-responsive promoter family protein [Crocosphaera sp.]|nr:GH3 auxin-responsive promoter family protein [Crocosphaera sp.]